MWPHLFGILSFAFTIGSFLTIGAWSLDGPGMFSTGAHTGSVFITGVVLGVASLVCLGAAVVTLLMAYTRGYDQATWGWLSIGLATGTILLGLMFASRWE